MSSSAKKGKTEQIIMDTINLIIPVIKEQEMCSQRSKPGLPCKAKFPRARAINVRCVVVAGVEKSGFCEALRVDDCRQNVLDAWKLLFIVEVSVPDLIT